MPAKPQTAKEMGSKRRNQTSCVLANAGDMQAGKPIHRSAINHWKASEKDLALYFRGAQDYKIISVALIATMSFPAAGLRAFGGHLNRQQ